MEQFLSIKREFAELLAGQFAPYGVRVTGEFPAESHRRPGGCMLAVGIDGVGFPAVPSGGNQIQLTLRFDILCPAGGSPGCHEVFELLCGVLVPKLGIREVHCGPVSYDRGFDAFCMTATAVLDGILTGADPVSGSFDRIIIRANIK